MAVQTHEHAIKIQKTWIWQIKDENSRLRKWERNKAVSLQFSCHLCIRGGARQNFADTSCCEGNVEDSTSNALSILEVLVFHTENQPRIRFFSYGLWTTAINHAKTRLVIIWAAGTPRYRESTAPQYRKEEWNDSHWRGTCSVSRRKAMTLFLYQTSIVKGHRTSWKTLM